MRFYTLLLCTSTVQLLSCCTGSPSHKATPPCARSHAVYLYATNWSGADSLAHAYLRIDGTTYLDTLVNTNETGSERLQKIIRLCEGPHRVVAQFSQYKRDTVLTVNANSSLLISMNYNPKWEAQDNGMMINMVVRDGKDRGGD